jgi:hypothetical protein
MPSPAIPVLTCLASLAVISIEATAGVMDLGGDLNGTKFYGVGDLALYATDNLRLTVGASSVANFESAHLGAEWYLADIGLPASLTVNGRAGEHGFTSIMAGFSFYFGGEDKSLIRRHREDDPRNRSLDIFGAGGAVLGGGTLGTGPTCDNDPETPLPPCNVPNNVLN